MVANGLTVDSVKVNDSVCRNKRQAWKRLCHWGPAIALCIIFYIAFFALRCCFYTAPPSQSLMGTFQFGFISFMLYRILKSYFSATIIGPGFVPPGWKPQNPKVISKLQFCQICDSFKPPRSHHCRSCQRCVLKMDHHCPWINTCCGHLNHGHFVWFLLSVPLGCTASAFVLARHLYQLWINVPYVFSQLQFSSLMYLLTDIFLILFALGLAVGVTFAVGGLGLYQLYYIQKNQTGIESWIVAKADHWRKESSLSPFIYPYDLGRWRNITQVLTFSGTAVGDGIHWPIRAGSGEYDLTIEQLRQKQKKKLSAREFYAHRSYNGRYCPCCQFGCRVACDTPYPDEFRLQVEKGDIISVTRGSKHWLYGQLVRKVQRNGGSHRHSRDDARGWVPRACVTEVRSTSTCDLNCDRPKVE